MTEKAQIIKVDEAGLPLGAGIPCMFNPENYTVSKKNKWQPAKTGGNNSNNSGESGKNPSDAPQLDFGGGGSQTLKVKLFFDTTDSSVDVYKSKTKMLFDLMMIEAGKKEPPLCQFKWGSYSSPPCVITDINQKFTYFSADGTPLRAELDVTFQEQHKPIKGQNPTSVGPARRTWLVRSGDRLDLIAFEKLGEATRWPEIAKMNNLLNPLDLPVGQILNIPLE